MRGKCAAEISHHSVWSRILCEGSVYKGFTLHFIPFLLLRKDTSPYQWCTQKQCGSSSSDDKNGERRIYEGLISLAQYGSGSAVDFLLPLLEAIKAYRGRGGKITSGNGQAWSSPSPRGQWRTVKSGGNWLQNHLCCPNNPRG